MHIYESRSWLRLAGAQRRLVYIRRRPSNKKIKKNENMTRKNEYKKENKKKYKSENKNKEREQEHELVQERE